MPERILVLIPCYNCAPQVSRVVAQFDSEAAQFVETILVLDNRSIDGTEEAAIAAATARPGLDIRVARNRKNLNLGGSHKAAFHFATEHGYSHVLVLHGDDQGNIFDALPVLRRGDHLRMDACLGARFLKDSRLLGYSALRIFGNRMFNALFSLVLGHPVLDLGSGLNIFGRRVMNMPQLTKYSDNLTFNIFLLLGMFRQKMAVEFFPISWREDDQRSNVKLVSQALDTLGLLLHAKMSARSFWAKDHRSTKHSDYRFDFVYPIAEGVNA